MKILVTGGLGFIGSHTVVELQREGFETLVIDDLSNTSEKVLGRIAEITGRAPVFEKIDLKEKAAVADFFRRHPDIGGTIHFAASKAVGESMEKPLTYYENNLHSLVFLLRELQRRGGGNFIFSSSCTVYGQAEELPITELAALKPAESPYGNTKQIGEAILRDACAADPSLRVLALRYFNPIGAHPSGKIGELPLGIPQNLVPFITQTAAGRREELRVFGHDYPTRDGTCIRDYIHVVDLAKAHIAALKHLIEKRNRSNFDVFNIGTGRGNTVLEVIAAFEKAAGMPLRHVLSPRRPGDVTAAYADTAKARRELGWEAQCGLEESLATAWRWERNLG